MSNPTEGQITLLSIRDPDESTEFVTDGEVEIIEIDLGSTFDGKRGFQQLPDDEQQEIIADWREQVEHLDEDGDIRKRVEDLIEYYQTD
jgi:hypothetical protein